MKCLIKIGLISTAAVAVAVLMPLMKGGDGFLSTITPQRVEAQSTLPIYKPPVRGAVARRIESGTRGAEDAVPSVYVLAPDGHAGLTVHGQPSLFWYLSKDSTYPVEITLIDSQGINPLIESRLDPPIPAGIQRIDLADFNVSLAPKERYQWSVALIPDTASRSQDVMASGFIERIEPGDLASADQEQLNRIASATPTAKPGIYAQAGLWYDAMTALSDMIDAPPAGISQSELRQERATLLEQVNLAEPAAYDRQIK